MVVNRTTGEVARSYSSDDELDGTTYVKCGNRRAQACPTCSAEYKGDAWHLLLCGLAGGKGIPDTVADHPCTFATFTAPSFGAGARDPAERTLPGTPGQAGLSARPARCGAPSGTTTRTRGLG